MDLKDLIRLKRFAARGGIGKCTAVADCVAEGPNDLMFFEGDEITVLAQFDNEPGVYLGCCEDVVGRFYGSHVLFHGKLRKPFPVSRSSTSTNPPSSSSPHTPTLSITTSHSPISPPTTPGPSDDQPLSATSTNSPEPNAVSIRQKTLSSYSEGSLALNEPPSPSKLYPPEGTSPTVQPSLLMFPTSDSTLDPPPPVDTSSLAGLPTNNTQLSSHDQDLLAPVPEEIVVNNEVARPLGSNSIDREFEDSTEKETIGTALHDQSEEVPLQTSADASEPPSRHSVRGSGATRDDLSESESYSRGVSMALSAADSDGEFGIGMQFIQDSPSTSHLPDLETEPSDNRQSRSSSIWSEDSIALPSWRRDSALAGFSGGLAALGERLGGGLAGGNGSSSSSNSSRLSTEGLAPQVFSSLQDESSPSSPRSPLQASTPEIPPPSSPRSMNCLVEDGDPVGHRVDTPSNSSSVLSPSEAQPIQASRSRESMRMEFCTNFETSDHAPSEDGVLDIEPPSEFETEDPFPSTLPVIPLPDSPQHTPLQDEHEDDYQDSSDAESDAGGYYEQDEDIYDDYRYSRYSIMSRKSRKSVLPPPKMPTNDSFTSMGLPSPSFKSFAESIASSRAIQSSTSVSTDKQVSTLAPSKSISSKLGTACEPTLLAPVLPESDTLLPTPTFEGSYDAPSANTEEGSHTPILQRAGEGEDTSTTTNPSKATGPVQPNVGPSMTVHILTDFYQKPEELLQERSQSDDDLPLDDAGSLQPPHEENEAGEEDLPETEEQSHMHKEDSVQPVHSARPSIDDLELPAKQLHDISDTCSYTSASSLDQERHVDDIPSPRISSRKASQSSVNSIQLEKVELNPSPTSSPTAPSGIDTEPHKQPSQGSNTNDPISTIQSDPPHSIEQPGTRAALPSDLHLIADSPLASVVASMTSSAPLFSPSGRPLTFLPHPNAPKPLPFTASPRQPIIHSYQTLAPPNYPSNRPSPSLYHALAGAVALSRTLPVNNGVRRAVTIHGRMEYDLLTSSAPVRIDFIVDGDGRGRPVSPKPPPYHASPTVHPPNTPYSPNVSPSVGNPPMWSANQGSRHAANGARARVEQGTGFEPSQQVTLAPVDVDTGGLSAPSTPIPRANFFPRTQPRPRSRSLSEFTTSPIEDPLLQGRFETREEDKGNVSSNVPTLRTSQPGQSPISTSKHMPQPSIIIQPQRGNASPSLVDRVKPPAKMPSPLALGSSNALRSPPPSSPLAFPPLSPASFAEGTSARRTDSIHSTSSIPPSPASFQSSTPGLFASSRAALRNVASSSGLRSGIVARPNGPSHPPAGGNDLSAPRRSMSHGAISEINQSVTTQQTSQHNEEKPPSIHRSNSLKSKMSFSALRSKSAARTASKDTPSATDGPAHSLPGTPSRPQFEFTEKTVQVKEGGAAAEFELIRPVINRISSIRASEDSVGLDAASLSASIRERLSIRSESRTDADSYRSNSPVIIAKEPFKDKTPESSEPDAASVEAHRNRELKWISAMGSIPASTSRKNKKIRKLVHDGVPNSVRSVVWMYLTDIKSKRMSGLYEQLCSRGRVAATTDIQRDAERCFPNQPQLRDPAGPIVTLLQAYLAMIPDLQYSQGLAAIAGTILLQSPEEDSFWTFIALMDNHVRGYFAINSVQMDVDAALFAKAVEVADAQMARKLFRECLIHPVDLCRPWFSALFALTLPPTYLHRIWDFFILDGVSFLFRVALAILSICRRAIMETRGLSASAALALVARPPESLWPRDVESFLSIASGVKLKEDGLRRIRPKVEATLRQQNSAQARPVIQGKEMITLKTILS